MGSLWTRLYVFLIGGVILIYLAKIALVHLYYTYWVYGREMPDYLPAGRVVVGIAVIIGLGSVLIAAKPWRLLKK